MHLRDYLNDIPLKALKTIADTLGINVEYRARIKLMNAIDRAFWDSTLVERLLKSLTDDHRRILSIIAYSYTAGVSDQIIIRKMEKLTGLKRHNIIALIDDLVPLALIGGIHEEHALYFSPEGIAAQLRKLFASEMTVPPDTRVKTPTFSPTNLLEDIYSFLATVYKESIPLTLMGKLRKTALDRLFNGSPTCADPGASIGEDQRNSFVIDYCRERGLVDITNREAVITPRLSGWLALTTTDRVHDILSFALTNRMQDTPSIVALHGILSEMDTGASFEARKLALFLDERTAAPGGLKRIEPRLRDTLGIMHQLGLFAFRDGRYMLIEPGARIFRGGLLAQDENPGRHFIVQPNFEVIVGPEFEPRLRFMLELLAERKSRDTVLTFSVTQKGIARARERDMSTDEIIRFFHEHSRNHLPQNVSFSIESWANSYGTVFFENLTLMRCRTPEICDSIVHMPAIVPYIMEQLSDTVLVVSSKHINAISEQLKRSGFLPEAFGETAPDSVRNGTGYTHVPLSALIGESAMPDIHRNFIFPEQILTGNDEL